MSVLLQMAVVQTGAMQLSVDNFGANAGHLDLKTDIQVKGVCVTQVNKLLSLRSKNPAPLISSPNDIKVIDNYSWACMLCHAV